LGWANSVADPVSDIFAESVFLMFPVLQFKFFFKNWQTVFFLEGRILIRLFTNMIFSRLGSGKLQSGSTLKVETTTFRQKIH